MRPHPRGPEVASPSTSPAPRSCKPYRSLSADVIGILSELGLLLRGELIWQKAEGATGSCAWGSFRSAAEPVLRDITERVIVASKGRFSRARTASQQAEGLPFRLP